MNDIEWIWVAGLLGITIGSIIANIIFIMIERKERKNNGDYNGRS